MMNDIVQLAPDGTHTNLSKWKPDAAIKKLVKSAEGKLALAQAHVVDSLETYEYVDKDLAVIAADIKKIEALEILAMGDLKAVIKERTKFFATAKKQFKAAKELLRTKMAAFNRRQEAVAREAQELATKAAIEQDMPAPTIVPATPLGNTTYRDKWEMECDDFNALILHIADEIRSGRLCNIVSLLMLDERRANSIAGDIQKDEHRFLPGLKVVNKRIAVT